MENKGTLKNFKSSLLIVISLILVALAFLSSSCAKKEPQSQGMLRGSSTTEAVNRPAPVLEARGFDVGSMWIYETLDSTLTIKVTDKVKEGDRELFVYSFFYGDKKIADEYRIQTKEYHAKVKSVQGESTVTVFEKPLILYRFPMKVGDKWTNRFEIGGVKFVSEVEVVSYEKVKTNGGVFMAYKIKHTTYPEDDKKSKIVDADWYNPNIGLIAYAKEGGENPKSLIKYSVKLIKY